MRFVFISTMSGYPRRNHGRHRSRRLRLEAKVLFYRALGRRAITAVRQLRRRIQPV